MLLWLLRWRLWIPCLHGWAARRKVSMRSDCQEVCPWSNLEAWCSDLSRTLRISSSGPSGVGKAPGVTHLTPSLSYKSKFISSKCSFLQWAIRARAVQMAGWTQMKTIFPVTNPEEAQQCQGLVHLQPIARQQACRAFPKEGSAELQAGRAVLGNTGTQAVLPSAQVLTLLHVCVCVCLSVSVCMFVYASRCVCPCLCMYMYSLVYTCAHTCMHVETRSQQSLPQSLSSGFWNRVWLRSLEDLVSAPRALGYRHTLSGPAFTQMEEIKQIFMFAGQRFTDRAIS